MVWKNNIPGDNRTQAVSASVPSPVTPLLLPRSPCSFSKEDHRIRYNRLQKYNTAISAVHGHNCPVHLSGKANETVYSIYMRIIMLCLYIMFTCIGYIIEYQKSTSFISLLY